MEDSKNIREVSGQKRGMRQGESSGKKQKTMGMLPPRPPQAKARSNENVCFQCGQPGHYKSSCPQLVAAKTQVAMLRAQGQCFQCGQVGHRKVDCPQVGFARGSVRPAQSVASRQSPRGNQAHDFHKLLLDPSNGVKAMVEAEAEEEDVVMR